MSEQLEIIRRRHSARGRFDRVRSITDVQLAALLEAARWAPTPHNMQNFHVIAVDDASVLDAIGRLRTRVTPDFLRENYAQLSFSNEELVGRKTGILGSTFPSAFLDPDGFDEEMPPRLLRETLQDCPLLLIFVYDATLRAPASEGDFLGNIGLGCVLENVWLVAESLGLSFQVVSSLASPDADEALRQVLALPDDVRVAFGCRVGYSVEPSATAPRVRRTIEDLAFRNCYGQSIKFGTLSAR